MKEEPSTASTTSGMGDPPGFRVQIEIYMDAPDLDAAERRLHEIAASLVEQDAVHVIEASVEEARESRKMMMTPGGGPRRMD
jgi:hypothetical protein